MSKTLEISAEINYEDEAVNWDKNIRYGRSRLAHIYKEWAFEVANRFESENKDVHGVCAHIKGRLKIRGVSDSSRDYVAECLPPEFKETLKDGSRGRDYPTGGKDGLPSSDNIYEDLDQKVMNLHYKSQWEPMTDAELLEAIPRSSALKKAMIKQLREELAAEKQLTEDRGIKIPQFEKDSAEIPPEYFHGQSELYYSLEAFEEETTRIPNMIRDLKQRVYYFKPDQETAMICAAKMDEYRKIGFYAVRFMNMLMLKMCTDILTPSTDLKWGELLSGWFQMGDDRLTKYGNKGCGTKHAIPTGQFILKKYKDGHFDLIGLRRRWTREQIGDKSARQLIKLALEIVLANKCEQAVRKWMEDTILVEKVIEE